MKLAIKTIFIFLFLLPVTAAAALELDFEATPLFSNANILPGDSVTRTVTVTNTGEEAEDVLVSATNVFSGDLADLITLTIATTDTAHFTGSFNDFFDAGEVALGSLSAAEQETFEFTANFGDTTENDLMGSSFGFDLVVGFEGGLQVVNRSSSGGGADLRVFNESVVDTDSSSGSVQVRWNTNRSATTYIVCGELSAGPFELNPNEDLFGYQFSVPEVASDTDIHIVTLSGLLPGSYECRPASRWSQNADFTVGSPTVFTVAGRDVLPSPTPTETLPAVARLPIGTSSSDSGTSSSISTPSGQVAGAATGTVTAAGQGNIAQAAGSETDTGEVIDRGLPWWVMFLGLFLLLFLLLLFYRQRKHNS